MMKTFVRMALSIVPASLMAFLPVAAFASEAALDEATADVSAAAPAFLEELLGLKWYTVVLLIALLFLGVALYLGAKRTRWDSRRIANAAMCVAIAFILSCIRLYKMPQGGSITPASMLPLAAFALACGPMQGAMVGCAYGLLELIQDPSIIHPIQLLVDYPLAFAALALGGLAGYLPVKDRLKLPIAVVIGSIGRYCMAVLSGTVFFAEYAPVGQSALVYSLIYNISYLVPDAMICTLVACLPGMWRIVDLMRGKLKAKH